MLNKTIGDTTMTEVMTQRQFDTYLEYTGNGISSDNGNVAYVSNRDGDIVAMYWRGEISYLETLDEPIIKDPLNPMTWNATQWHDVVNGFFLSVGIFAFTLIILWIFA